MTLRTTLAATAAVVALVFAACGGDGGNGSPSGNAARISDPATAPVAEADSEEFLTFMIRDNSVVSPSGATTTLSGDGSSTTGGTGGSGGGTTGATYAVQPGDSCSAIAARVEIELSELMSANPQIDANCTNLQPGQELRVPGGTGSGNGDDDGGDDEPADTPEPDSPGDQGQTHTVASGEICGTIADMYGVDVDELISLNNLDCTSMQIGQVIQIP